jgi:predicted peptidase
MVERCEINEMSAYKIRFVFLFLLAFIIAGFISNEPDFGWSKIKKNNDTLTLKKTIAEIRNVSNAVFDSASFKGENDIEIKYRLLKPLHNDTAKKFPLVVVFHGSGAIGSDNKSQLGALVKLWALPGNREKYPAYVLAPQFPSRSSNYALDKKRNVLVSSPQNCLRTALDLIDSLKQTLNIDPERIYLVGFSMGGSTVINALSARPDWFAAGVSISGVPQFVEVKKLADIPIWLMHGNRDTENPFSSDKQFYKEVSVKNKTRFWEFENTGHDDIFSTIILGEEIPGWLFSKKKN